MACRHKLLAVKSFLHIFPYFTRDRYAAAVAYRQKAEWMISNDRYIICKSVLLKNAATKLGHVTQNYNFKLACIY